MSQNIEEVLKDQWLRYMIDSKPGIIRKMSGKHWIYYDIQGKKITDQKTIDRINKIVIPPARASVRISPVANWHIQATWLDAKWRKQYRYHPDWVVARNENKFSRMKEFGKALPKIRQKIDSDLKQSELSQTKILALALTIMDKTWIRVGNEIYQKLYGSFWLTTLRNKHAIIVGETLQFQFVGKKWIKQNISLKSRKLARIIQQCKALPGHDLFEYIDTNWDIKTINSDLINHYIKDIAEDDFTAKDFRTWHGTVYALQVLHTIINGEEKQSILYIIDEVAKELGNTRAVCRKYYIHPLVFSLYEDEKSHTTIMKSCTVDDHTSYELLLCKLLNK